MGVTKTDFIRAMQCPKMLWLDKHKPEEKVIPPQVQQRMDKGNEFGDSAMGMFGPYVEVTTYKENGKLDYTQMIEKTKECISSKINVICEASFSFYGNFCSVDILKKTATGYEMYEVKDSKKVTETFLMDLAFQRYLLEKSEIKIEKACIVYHGTKQESLFEISDQTQATERLFWIIDEHIWQFGQIKKQTEEYEEKVGTQCEKPYRCWYYDYCHKK